MISDTQAPMRVEKLFLKSHHNEHATSVLFQKIDSLKPMSLFILGDVTSWSAKERKWRSMDGYLKACHEAGISTHALWGNHDVMGSVKKGKANFKKRFPDANPDGYYVVSDSIAFVLLNSNFKRMKPEEINSQQKWYEETLALLDKDLSIAAIIVSCHHAPFTNSKIVRPSLEVQEKFVPLFLSTPKCKLFITGHAHAFEQFVVNEKNFLVIGGGGGIHQPLSTDRVDVRADYKPEFHFLGLTLHQKHLRVDSYPLYGNFSSIGKKNILDLPIP
ncbi:MAG: metallophosphoesterase [Bacteroidetes bacterium]|nr:metallophosphoesterase [Bacteroidota bacterium]